MIKRRAYMNWRVGLLFLIFFGLWSLHYVRYIKKAHEQRAGGTAKQIESTSFRATIITPYLGRELVPGRNLMYSAAFQVAWNDLCDSAIGESVRMMRQAPLVEVLNQQQFPRDAIDSGSYFAIADIASTQTYALIADAVDRAYTGKPPVFGAAIEGMFVVYGALFKNLTFAAPFERFKEPLHFVRGAGNTKPSELRSFGVSSFDPQREQHQLLAEQVILYLADDAADTFIIELLTENEQDQVVLARIEPGTTLLATVQTVQQLLEELSPQTLRTGDRLQIPMFNFDVTHSYQQLLGRALLNEKFTGYELCYALQQLRFRLYQRGIKPGGTVAAVDTVPRRLIFDGPFLVYVQQRGSHLPYLVLWVDNPEIMLFQR